jgi:peptidoglycan/LPS O-acetylase OafA/YrhL
MLLGQVPDSRSPVRTQGETRMPQLKALTSIRFFVALHVALFHMVRPFSLWGPLEPVMRSGYVGVSFFFVLSGFILTYSHALEYESGRGLASQFWIARFARIYPVYLLSALAAGWVDRSQFHRRIHWLAFAVDLGMIQSWSMRMVNFFNVPGWTISTEAFFYFIFPAILLRLSPRSRSRALLALAAMWLLAIAVPVLCLWLYPPASMGLDATGAGGDAVFRVTRLPLLALPQFLAGILLGWMYLRFRPARRLTAWLAAAGVFATTATLSLSGHIPFILLHNGLLIPAFAMLILGLAQSNWISRALSVAPLVLLGEASFAFYLIHFLFNEWTTDQFQAGTGVGSALWKLALVIPISILLHLGVERPCRRSILAWWLRRQPPQSPHVSGELGQPG